MDIDLVYLWVDGNDPAWQAKKNVFTRSDNSNEGRNCAGRYADNDELLYSLRALELYAPWIRRIFIVTDNQVPKWLNLEHPKIKIIDHRDILPSRALPSFNSAVIEHALHRIPDLAEHFLYANDDMFFNRPVKPEDFFTPDGKPIIRFNRRPFRKLTLFLKQHIRHKPLSYYNRTICNSSELVERKYGKYIGHKTHHNIDAYRLSDYRHTFETFKDEIEATFDNHIRNDNDIQRNIYSFVPAIEKRSEVRFVSRKTSFRLHIDNPKHFAKLDKVNPMLFCLNDSEYATDADRKRVAEYLQKRFPQKSEFEK